MTATPATLHWTTADSSLGLVLLARTDRGLAAVLLGDDRDALLHDLRARFPRAMLHEGDAAVRTLAERVAHAIDAPDAAAALVDLPLDPGGTEFQRAVWQALREIPAGTTTTYTALAERVGRPAAVRAVGHACGANPLAVVVPCHRAVRRDGALAGYRWGIERKRALLALEAAG